MEDSVIHPARQTEVDKADPDVLCVRAFAVSVNYFKILRAWDFEYRTINEQNCIIAQICFLYADRTGFNRPRTMQSRRRFCVPF